MRRVLVYRIQTSIYRSSTSYVDNDSLGPTMEWGFLADLLRRPEALALVDELFIELHFFAPSLNWVHLTHSMKQAFDVLRQLRACGLPVHAWP